MLQEGFQILHPGDQLLLFSCRQPITNARTSAAEKLPGDGRIGTLNPASKHRAGQSLKALFQAGEFRGGPATPAAPASLRGRPPSVLRPARVVHVAQVGAVDSYTSTAPAIPLYSRAFGH